MDDRAQPEKPFSLLLDNPQPVDRATVWRSVTWMATVGTFLLLFGVLLHFARPLLLPITAALIVGMTLEPVVRWLSGRAFPSWAAACLVVVAFLFCLASLTTFLASYLADLLGNASEIGSKLSALDRPLASIRALQQAVAPPEPNAVKIEAALTDILRPVVDVLSPAAVQSLIFAGTLFFLLVNQATYRRHLVALFTEREAKLRALKILADVERNLTSYLATVTVINLSIGVTVAIAAWLLGLPNAPMLGVMAAVLNYVPYIGPAITTGLLFIVGLVALPSFEAALVAPIAFVALATLEGHFITPAIIGRRLVMDSFLVFLALAFWAWMWGPIGALLAVPLLIVGMVLINHLIPSNRLPLAQ